LVADYVFAGVIVVVVLRSTFSVLLFVAVIVVVETRMPGLVDPFYN
jgi:hypothetical protein